MAIENTTIYLLMGYLLTYMLLNNKKDLTLLKNISYIGLAFGVLYFGSTTTEQIVGIILMMSTIILAIYEVFFVKNIETKKL